MKRPDNPFELFSYLGSDYFCDREQEIQDLNDALKNRRNTVLVSPRRLGKTSLIQHWHHQLDEGIISIYMDIMDTESDTQFANAMVSKIVNVLDQEDGFMNFVLDKFRNLSPQIGIDPGTGLPTVKLKMESPEDVQISLNQAMSLLFNKEKTVQISIDEFQQIANYKKGTRIDATLRSFYPKAKNVHFLYLGSEEHLLKHMFTHPKAPMYASSQMMQLHPIGYQPYFDFIHEKFSEYRKGIGEQYIHEILTWTNRHTFYTQFLCNQLFSKTKNQVSNYLMHSAKTAVLRYFEANFLHYERMLSDNQWKALKAIAQEKNATEIYGVDFLSKYTFSASSLKLAINSLLSQNLIIETKSDAGKVYTLSDIFLQRWLER